MSTTAPAPWHRVYPDALYNPWGLTSTPAAALLGTPVLVQLFGEVVVVLLAHVLLLLTLILPVLLILIVFVHAVAFAVHLGVGLLGHGRGMRRGVLLVRLTGRGG